MFLTNIWQDSIFIGLYSPAIVYSITFKIFTLTSYVMLRSIRNAVGIYVLIFMRNRIIRVLWDRVTPPNSSSQYWCDISISGTSSTRSMYWFMYMIPARNKIDHETTPCFYGLPWYRTIINYCRFFEQVTKDFVSWESGFQLIISFGQGIIGNGEDLFRIVFARPSARLFVSWFWFPHFNC